MTDKTTIDDAIEYKMALEDSIVNLIEKFTQQTSLEVKDLEFSSVKRPIGKGIIYNVKITIEL